MIIPVYKKIGESTHLLAKKIGDKFNSKATHTGTLDPMAEGVVIVLTAEDRFQKANFSDWKKTYQFEIMLGVDTDSLDLLGLSTKIIDEKNVEKIQENNSDKLTKNLNKIIPKFIGEQTQLQPFFSAKRVDGKSQFDKAKAGEKIETVKNKINIYSLEILGNENISLVKLEKEIVEKISLIKGNFRQEKILENWHVRSKNRGDKLRNSLNGNPRLWTNIFFFLVLFIIV